MSFPYSQYLSDNIQSTLEQAVAAACISKPNDAVEFVAQYLRNTVQDLEKLKKVGTLLIQ